MVPSPSWKRLTDPYTRLIKPARGSSNEGKAAPMQYREKEEPYSGLSFGSAYERNVYVALRQLGWPAEAIGYQVPIHGGRLVREGLVIDFVLYTPTAIPIQVQSDWWHRDGGQELVEQASCLEWFGRLPITFRDTDADTVANALQAVMREIGRYG